MEESYYKRYMKQTWIFQGIGIVLVAAGILVNELTGRQMLPPVYVLAIIGIILLAIGGSSSRPHVVIKSFASLLQNDPSKKNAEEFLYVLEKVGRISLVKRSLNLIDTAIYVYEKSPEADPELLEKIKATVEKNIKKRVL